MLIENKRNYLISHPPLRHYYFLFYFNWQRVLDAPRIFAEPPPVSSAPQRLFYFQRIAVQVAAAVLEPAE